MRDACVCFENLPIVLDIWELFSEESVVQFIGCLVREMFVTRVDYDERRLTRFFMLLMGSKKLEWDFTVWVRGISRTSDRYNSLAHTTLILYPCPLILPLHRVLGWLHENTSRPIYEPLR